MKRKKSLAVVFLSFLMLAGCPKGVLRPGALNPADQRMFDTLFYTQFLIEDARPKVEPCHEENRHPQCGTLGHKTTEFNYIVDSYEGANATYQAWRVGIANGESIEVASIETLVNLTLQAIRADSVFFNIYRSFQD